MKIEFKNRNEAELVITSRQEEVGQAVNTLGLAGSQPVLVLVGGASGVTDDQQPIISG